MSKAIQLDPILAELKPFGKYNVYNYILLLIPIYFSGLYASAWLFESPEISYRCRIPACEKSLDKRWVKFAIPKNGDEYSKCKQYTPTEGKNSCEEISFRKKEISCQNGYVYENQISIVNDYDLGCQHWQRVLVGTIHNTGLFIAIPLTGLLSDIYGRKKVLAISTVMNAVFALMRSFSNTYLMFMILEFLEPALGGGAYTTAFVLAMELVEPKGRIFGSVLVSSTFVFGLISMAGLAWWLQDWRTFIRVTYTPGLFIILYLCILNESVRWLISKERYEEAVTILRKAAKMNKVTLSKDLMAQFNKDTPTKDISQEDSLKDKHVEKISRKRLFNIEDDLLRAMKSSVMIRRVACCSFLWITCTFVYYGISIHSIALAGNMYLNFMYACAVELPANFSCIFILRRFGRKKPLMMFYMLSGLLCIAVPFVPKQQTFTVLILNLMGKFTITVAYCTVHIFVSEVFPTNIRQSFFALCSSFGQIGSALAPLTPLMELQNKNLPTIFFGLLATISAALVLTLPETHNIALPSTLKEAENLNKKNKKRNFNVT